MEIWGFVLSHIATFSAGIALGRLFFRTLWKVALKRPGTSPALAPVYLFRFGFLAVGLYFMALAVSFGMWLDRLHPAEFSWAAAMFLISIAAFCLNAWYWMKKKGTPWISVIL